MRPNRWYERLFLTCIATPWAWFVFRVLGPVWEWIRGRRQG